MLPRHLAPILFAPVKPILDLNYARSGALLNGETFTRASGGTVFDSIGTLLTPGNNVPRFDYDPVTHAAKGLLIEEARTNLLVRSAEFDNASWTKRGTASVSANAATAPDGTVTADLISGIANTTSGDMFQQVTAVNGTAYAPSIWIKRVSTTGTFQIANPANDANGRYDVNLAALGDGWERITASHAAVTVVAAFTGVSSGCGIHIRSTGVTALSFYLSDAQLEASTAAIKDTTYVSTTSAQATRAADVASVTLANGSYDVLVQDRVGAEWRDAVTVATGSYSLTPRSGQRHIARLRLYPAGRLSTAQKTAMQVAA